MRNGRQAVKPSRKILSLLAAMVALPTTVSAAGGADIARDWRQGHEQAIVDEFSALLRLPNVSSNQDDIRANARHIMRLLQVVGLEPELLETGQGNPAIFAERQVDASATTLMLYIHYDGQPVKPEDWASDPWEPVMRDAMVEAGGKRVPMTAPFDPEWRIFARSAGDDKAPIIALTSALKALDEAGISPSINLKLFLDGEEEVGSPGLRAMLEEHGSKLDADLWLFCDGPVHQSRRQQLVYGVRGAYGFNLTVYGANRPLHSGHYGNWAPNPIVLLTDLVRSMRDPTGHVLVEGFYDQVRAPTETELAAVAASPKIDDSLLSEFGITRPETAERLELAIMRPGMNLRGIQSGGVGRNSRNAIQPSATASIGLRLVPGQTPEYLREAIERHVRKQGYRIIREAPTAEDRKGDLYLARIEWSASGGYPAYRTPMDHPLARKISDVLNGLNDGQLIQTPTMGGSLPIFIIDQVLETPVLILPVANHDDNQHGADENLRLQNLWDAIETYAALLTEL
jgi:acetylornithine deacetylase/succinyl-diaminopimelate desuccinylase-like protein